MTNSTPIPALPADARILVIGFDQHEVGELTDLAISMGAKLITQSTSTTEARKLLTAAGDAFDCVITSNNVYARDRMDLSKRADVGDCALPVLYLDGYYQLKKTPWYLSYKNGTEASQKGVLNEVVRDNHATSLFSLGITLGEYIAHHRHNVAVRAQAAIFAKPCHIDEAPNCLGHYRTPSGMLNLVALPPASHMAGLIEGANALNARGIDLATVSTAFFTLSNNKQAAGLVVHAAKQDAPLPGFEQRVYTPLFPPVL